MPCDGLLQRFDRLSLWLTECSLTLAELAFATVQLVHCQLLIVSFKPRLPQAFYSLKLWAFFPMGVNW